MSISKTLRSWRLPILTVVLVVLTTALVELSLGRLPICKCGYVSLWYGNTYGAGNSQHLVDWYTPSHFIHGLLFYGFLWLVARRYLSVKQRLVVAIVIECAWEILENSPLIIDRYRSVTSALDYVGDSVINSVSDITFAGLGFLAAWKWPVKATVAVIIGLELLTGFLVRDNLTLNVIMLIKPVPVIKEWQLKANFVPPALKSS